MIAHDATTAEDRRQAVQVQIESRRSMAERNRLGQFATPNLLAVEIASYIRSLMSRRTGTIRFADLSPVNSVADERPDVSGPGGAARGHSVSD